MRLSLLLLLIATVDATAQRTYTVHRIKAVADSVLRASISERVFRSADCAGKPYYQSRVGSEEVYDHVPDEGFTAGDFLRAVVRYRFNLPWLECAAFNHITGVTEVALDSNLRPVALPVLDSLPDFVLLNEPCGLLTKAEAIAIAGQHNLYIVNMQARLRFLRNPKRFVWYLSEDQTSVRVDTSFLAAARAGQPFQLPFKTMRIDARTGEAISNKMLETGTEPW